MAYVLESSVESRRELKQLDLLHTSLADYFGGRLSLAPLEEIAPKAVLELGAGSGAWAIDAAMRFPQAKIIATDISPMPRRVVPPNLHFLKLDVTQPLPFEHGMFDIIHARLLLIHLPDVSGILKQIIKLLKPGGWLLLEDTDDTQRDEYGHNTGLADISPLTAKFHDVLRAHGADPLIATNLEGVIRRSNAFMQVNTKMILLPLSGQDYGRAENALGAVWRDRLLHLWGSYSARLANEGITPEDYEQFSAQMNNSSLNLTSALYFLWAKKKLD